MRAFRLLPLLLIVFVWPLAAPADTVVLVNGDRLTGDIKGLEDGKLVLQSEYLDTIQLKWSDIRSIESDATFSVLTADGDRYDGELGRSGPTTSVGAEPGSAVELPSDTIARIARGGRRRGIAQLVSALDGSADIGYSVARGNQDQAQSSLGATAAYSSAHYSFQASLDSLFARQDGARAQSRHALNTRMDRYVNARFFGYGVSGFERNERRRLDLRSRLGGGLGWNVRERSRSSLLALGGFAYMHERFRRAENRIAAEAFLGVEWEARLFRTVELDMRLVVSNNQLDRGRARVEYDGSLRVPIAGRFNYTLRLFDRYDTRPAEGVERNDYGIVSGLGLSF